jgi:hypothetical protein
MLVGLTKKFFVRKNQSSVAASQGQRGTLFLLSKYRKGEYTTEIYLSHHTYFAKIPQGANLDFNQ